jgi:DNA-binding beta-propeller fold protein YncE
MPRGIAVSGDGKSVYVVSEQDDAIARFKRSKRNGALTYKGCITGETESGPVSGGGSGACRAIGHDAPGGASSGLDRLRSAVVSGDGRAVYAVSGDDDSVATFKRSRKTGALSYQGCITGETQSGPGSGGGSGACKAIGHASGFGGASGLDSPEQLVAGGDGKSVYVVTQSDDDVARFKRARRTGRLTYRNCLTGDTAAGPVGRGGSGACRAIPHASAGGGNSGLQALYGVAVAGSGRSLYTASQQDDAVGRFNRNRRTGALTYKSCITGETQSGPASGGGSGACKAIGHASLVGSDSGLDRLSALVASSDGRSVYTGSVLDDAVARFTRARSGALTYKTCITGETESGPVSGGGSGACKAIGHASSGGVDSGLHQITFLALTRDNKSIYAAAPGDSAVARFKRAR